MPPDSISFTTDFLDAVLRLKCSQGDKDILFAIVRILKGTDRYQGGVLSYSIAEYLERDPNKIARRLNKFIQRNIIMVIRGPRYLPLRLYAVNYNYNEWKIVKHPPAIKKNLSEPTFWDDIEAASEEKSKPDSKRNPKCPATKTFEMRYGLRSFKQRKYLLSERVPKKVAGFQRPYRPFRKCP